MTLRPLTPQDAAAFHDLRLRGLVESPSAFASSHEEEAHTPLESVAARLTPSDNDCVIGAFVDETLAGIVGLHREHHTKLAHKFILWGMYVDPAQRRRGLARALVAAAIERAARTPGIKQINLGVNAANTPAIALYESLGFIAWGRERACMYLDGLPHDEVHMARYL